MELRHTSHSAIEDYNHCPQMFKLKRVDKVPYSQLLAGPAGSALHTMTEDYDNGKEVTDFRFYLNAQMDLDESYITIRDEDYNWWSTHGQLMFEDYKRWREFTNWELISAEGRFEVQPEGLAVPFVGYIDRVFRMSTNHTVIVDIKTKFRMPKTSIQLNEYAAASRVNGSQVDAVTFYNARTGKTTGLEWPIDWDEMRLVSHVAPIEQAILADEFPPKASANNCRYCPVKEHCDYRWGRKK